MSGPVLVFRNSKSTRSSTTSENLPPLLSRKLRWMRIYAPHAFTTIERLTDVLIESFKSTADTDEDLEALRELPGERRP